MANRESNWLLNAGRQALEDQCAKAQADIQGANFEPEMKLILTNFLSLIVCKANCPQTFNDLVGEIHNKIKGSSAGADLKQILFQIVQLIVQSYELNTFQKCDMRSERSSVLNSAVFDVIGSSTAAPSSIPPSIPASSPPPGSPSNNSHNLIAVTPIGETYENTGELPKEEEQSVEKVESWMEKTDELDESSEKYSEKETGDTLSTIDRTHLVKTIGMQEAWDDCMLRFASTGQKPPLKVCSEISDDCVIQVVIDITEHEAMPKQFEFACEAGQPAKETDEIMENDWLIAQDSGHLRVHPVKQYENGTVEVLFIDDARNNLTINWAQLIHPENVLQFIACSPLKHAIKLPGIAMTPGLEDQARLRFKQYCTRSFFSIENPREAEFVDGEDIFVDVILSDIEFVVVVKPGFPQYDVKSLVKLLQRSTAFNGNETELFHEKLKDQKPSSLVEFEPDQVITVYAQSTNDIWCEDEHVFVQCSTVESNDSAKNAKFTERLSKFYEDVDRKTKVPNKHVTNRGYKKEWLHEGLVVVVPWLEFGEAELYRGVICGINVEKETALISHLDYYSIDRECPLDKIKVLENGSSCARFRDRTWSSFIVRLPIERFDQIRRDEIRAASAKHIAENMTDYGDPMAIDIVITGKDTEKVNVFIGDIITRRDDVNKQHATICVPDDVTVVEEEPAATDNLTILDDEEKIPGLEKIPIIDQLVFSPVSTVSTEPVNSYEVNPPTSDIKPDSESVSSDSENDECEVSSSDEEENQTGEGVHMEEEETEPENEFKWEIMNGGIEQFKGLIQNDAKDLIGEISHVKNGKIIFHATHHSAPFAPIDTTINHKTMGSVEFTGEVVSGDWIVESEAGAQYRARIVVESEGKVNLYRFDASSKAEIFGSSSDLRVAYPKILYPVEHDACFTFAISVTDEFDLDKQTMANIDECLPLFIKPVKYFKVSLLDGPAKRMEIENINKVIYPDLFEVLPAFVVPYIPESTNRFETDLKTVLQVDNLYGRAEDMNAAWNKVGKDFGIPLHCEEFWPKLAISNKVDALESVQSGHVCVPMDPICFGVRLDDLKYNFSPFENGTDFVPQHDALIHGAKFVLHESDGKINRSYVDTYQVKADLVDIDTGIRKEVDLQEILVYPTNAAKLTTTIIASLPVVVEDGTKVGHMLQKDAEPISLVNFQVVGYDSAFARYYVDFAYRTSEDEPYTSYVDHLVEKKMATRIESTKTVPIKSINLVEFNARMEKKEIREESSFEPAEPSEASSANHSMSGSVQFSDKSICAGVIPTKGVQVQLKSFQVMKSDHEQKLEISCLWLPRKGIDLQRNDNTQTSNMSWYKKILDGTCCQKLKSESAPTDMATYKLACESTEGGEVGFHRLTVTSDPGVYRYIDRPDLDSVTLDLDELYKIDDEVPEFESVSIVITDKQTNKYLKKKLIGYKQAEADVKRLAEKLNEGLVKLYFTVKDAGNGKSISGAIKVRGRPIALGVKPDTSTDDPDKTLSVGLFDWLDSQQKKK